jgi:hypothetical protein
LHISSVHVPQHAVTHNGISVLLWTLQCLHIYWYSLFLQMGKVRCGEGRGERREERGKKAF